GRLARRDGPLVPTGGAGRRRLLPRRRRVAPRRVHAQGRHHLHPRARRPPPRAVGGRGDDGRRRARGRRRKTVRLCAKGGGRANGGLTILLLRAPRPPLLTAFTYDDTHGCHREPGHPERPERLTAVRALLEREGLWDERRRLPTPEATDEALARVHPEAYL